MAFSNVIVDITISRRSFVFSQSCAKGPAVFTNVDVGLSVGISVAVSVPTNKFHVVVVCTNNVV